MKVFVTGVNGQLGYDVMLALQKQNINCLGTDRSGHDLPFPTTQLDLTDTAQVQTILNDYHPDIVIHCAAWTNVDAAEEPDNLSKVRAINVDATKTIAKLCQQLDAKMVYISTDYVFDGQGTEPWQPDDHNYAPINVYGQSKLDGELAVANTLDRYFIVRISWVFGQHGKNFVQTMFNVGQTHSEVRVVNDQIGTPTYTPDLAQLLVDMISTDEYGYYHATNSGGFISWADFTTEIFKQAHINSTVTPVTTTEYGLSKAARPANSRLDTSKLTEHGFHQLPTWQDALSRYILNLKDKK